MKTFFTTLFLFLLIAAPAQAQYESDTESIDSIIKALYASISGDAGEERDWDRFNNLFIPEARLMPTGINNEGKAVYRIWGPKEYVGQVGGILERDGFFETEASREVEQFGNIAHVFSTYDSKRTEDGEVFSRGINSIQLLFDQERWWVVSVFWSAESPMHPIPTKYDRGQWYSLFDGESLDGWIANENEETFSIEDGVIKVNGNRSHLFYNGSVGDHNFTDFEFKAKVMTESNSNSGIFFHTRFQDDGWPIHGYEAQVNNSYDTDPRRTASLYSFDDNTEKTFPDNEWMDYYIKVEGNHVVIKINGEVITDFTEEEGLNRTRRLSSGTFALQGHDPGSTVYFKEIYVREL
jgi:hypothetical protein